MDDNIIFGNSKEKFAAGEHGIAGYKGSECNIVIIRDATQQEYLDYLAKTNRIPEWNHGPFYYAAIGD